MNTYPFELQAKINPPLKTKTKQSKKPTTKLKKTCREARKVKLTVDLFRAKRHLAILPESWGTCSLQPGDPLPPVEPGSAHNAQNITFVNPRPFLLKP